MWSDDWVGIPYKRLGRSRENGFDCYGLFMALNAARRGVIIPDHRWTIRRAQRADLKQVETAFQRVTEPQEGDAILLRADEALTHVGYCIDRRLMLHTEKEGIGSAVECFTSIRWASRVEGFYRYVGP
jgi:cell wall-associated NlpC family hydrolase